MSDASEPLALASEDGAAVRSTTTPVVVGAVGDPVDALHQHVARLVLAHPGILRLEPTLLGALGRGRRTGLDGVALSVHGRVVDLDVNVATRCTHQARASLIELHAQVVDLVAQHGFVPGTVEISVLAIDLAPEPPTPVAAGRSITGEVGP